jgi:4-hydroxy-tetrahydrodipicolinate synthase
LLEQFVNHAPIAGVIAAIPTPVTETGEPDCERFVALARSLLADGCDGLNVLGTTGEGTSFGVEQRLQVMSAARKALPDSPLLVGTGAAALADAIFLTRQAATLGFSAALLLPPFYYKNVSEQGVISYVTSVAAATADSQIPLYLYNFPELSGVPFTYALVQRLFAQLGARIGGMKESSGDLELARSVASISPKLRVFPSNEAALLEARTGIFAGCISATANVNAVHCARAYHAGDEVAWRKAVAIRQAFDGLPMVPAVKYVLSRTRREPELAAVLPPLVKLPVAQQGIIHARQQALG